MSKLEAVNDLFFELLKLQKNIKKAAIASEKLQYDICEERITTPRERELFEMVYYCNGIVTDYIEQSCKVIDDILNS